MTPPADEQRQPDLQPPPALPEVESPGREEVLESVPSKEDVVANAETAEEIVRRQPGVEDILGRGR
jgi:hypothetical protein